MIVKCLINKLSSIGIESVKDRLQFWVNSDGQYSDLEIGKSYTVQAIEYLDNGIWYYLQINKADEPTPYASEFFAIADSSFPANWEVSFLVENDQMKVKRITFKEWANDDLFYEKLVDGIEEHVSIYEEKKAI